VKPDNVLSHTMLSWNVTRQRKSSLLGMTAKTKI